jgi:hypothetical protein
MPTLDLAVVGKWMVVLGLGLVVMGGLVWLAGRFGLPLGRLPGDIYIRRDGATFYFPLASGLLISLLLTVLINVVGRFLNR